MSHFEYPSYVSRFYDVIYRQFRSGIDFDYFLDKISKAQGSVLEVGVGTGRIFAEALNRGADVYGVDVSENMLAQLKSKLPDKEHHRLYLQDVRRLDIPGKFDLIVAPFRVFAHLLTTEDQLAALNNIHDHLAQDGKFIFDLYVPNLKMLSEGVKDKVDFDDYYEEGNKLKRTVSQVTDPINQVNHVEMIYEWDENGKWHKEAWNFKMRYYYRFELELLIRQSKLKLLNMFGDYHENLLIKDSKDFVVVCGK